jgi:ribosome-associated protein
MPKRPSTQESHQTFASRSTGDPESIRRFAIDAARLLADDKCEEISLLDVRQISQLTDYIIIGSGTSERQMRSALHHVEELGEQSGFSTFGSTDDDRSTWLLADFVDVVVHIFEPNTRAHYDLEMLWGDAPRIAWERPGDATRNRAGLQSGDRLE